MQMNRAPFCIGRGTHSSESEAITETWDKACSGNSGSFASTDTSDVFPSKSTESVDDDGSTTTEEIDGSEFIITKSSGGDESSVTEDDNDASTVRD